MVGRIVWLFGLFVCLAKASNITDAVFGSETDVFPAAFADLDADELTDVAVFSVAMKLTVVLLTVYFTTCPAVEFVKDFDVPAYTGLWFEIARIPNRNQPSGSCVTAHYTLSNDTAEPVDVFNREFNDNTQEYDSITGTARPADDSGEGRLLVTFPVAPIAAPYWVVDTDYVNFALVHSCVSVGAISLTSGWILSRTTSLSTQDLLRINAAIEANGIDGGKFEATRQDDACDYEGA